MQHTNRPLICQFLLSQCNREKLKRKLEIAGTMCNVEELTVGDFAAVANDFNIIGKKKFQKKLSATVPTHKVKSSGKGNKANRDEEKTKGNVKPPKGKQNKKDHKSKRAIEEDEDNNTLMKRRRKTELQIQVICEVH